MWWRAAATVQKRPTEDARTETVRTLAAQANEAARAAAAERPAADAGRKALTPAE
jgi:hypothetical protein